MYPAACPFMTTVEGFTLFNQSVTGDSNTPRNVAIHQQTAGKKESANTSKQLRF